jgi:hypothetical protein
MVGPAAKREAVTHLKAVMGLSERRACQIVSADRKTIRYRSNRPPEVDLRAKLRDLANEQRGDVTLFDQRPQSRLSVNSCNCSGHGFPLRHGADAVNMGG